VNGRKKAPKATRTKGAGRGVVCLLQKQKRWNTVCDQQEHQEARDDSAQHAEKQMRQKHGDGVDETHGGHIGEELG
jgi:hypothetical protein